MADKTINQLDQNSSIDGTEEKAIEKNGLNFKQSLNDEKDFLEDNLILTKQEAFVESIVFDKDKYQITTQTAELNVSPASTGHSTGESTLVQYVDGDSTNAINVTGASLIEGTTDNTKRNTLMWLYNNDLSGSVSDKTIVNIKNTDLPVIPVNPTVLTATVSDLTADNLVVVFSEAVNITDITGLLLVFSVGTTKTILSIISGSGTDTITFLLSAELESTDVLTFDYDGTNTIESVSYSLPLITGSTNVTNNVEGIPVPLFQYTFESSDYSDTSGNSNTGAETGTSYTFSNDSLIGTKSLDLSAAVNTSRLTAPVSSLGDFTRIAIVKIPSGAASNACFFSCENSNLNFQQTLFQRTADNLIRATAASTASGYAETLGISDAWFFVAQSFELSTGNTTIYVNDNTPYVDTIATTQQGGNVIMGGVSDSAGNLNKGFFDLIEYHNSVLTDAQVLEIYNLYFNV